MRMRDKAGLSMAPLLLRVALGVTFLWAGLGKVMVKEDFSSEQAAVLANAGVISVDSPAPIEQESEPAPTEETGDGLSLGEPAQIRTVSFQQDRYTAADFPDGRVGTRVLGLVIAMHSAANPGYDSDTGEPLNAYWPSALGSGQTALMLAWLVAIGEIVCGLGVLVGLLTRLSAIVLGCTMIGAAWLTEMGPATQSASATLGVLPGYDPFGMEWRQLLWQLMLMCGSFSLALLGAGTLSLDALFFRPKPTDDGDEAEGDDDDD